MPDQTEKNQMTDEDLQEREQQLAQAAHMTGIPMYMVESIVKYITTGRPVGGFLMAVLSNDLSMAVARADETNVRKLREYVVFLFNHAPPSCWGSPEKVEAWTKGYDPNA